MMKERATRPAAPTSGTAVHNFSLAKPILMCIILFILALFFRWLDSFLLRLDERLGEAILTKSLGFALVLLWVWATRHKPRDIGLHSVMLGQSLSIGALTTMVAFVLGYGVEFLLASQRATQPSLQLGAIDPKMGVAGGALFASWLVLGNFVNSFMEEGLFRGVMGRLARLRFNFWRTIWFQAVMFSIWHLPWVLKYYFLGQLETGGEIAISVVFNSLPQLFIGIVYGYFYLKTGSLWTPWVAHTLSNSTLNLLHVTTTEGLDTGLPVRMGIYLAAMLMSLRWVRHLARKQPLPEAKPWE